jgi:lipopolysaccharide transport system permease protein
MSTLNLWIGMSMQSSTSLGGPRPSSIFLIGALGSAWRHRELIYRLALRELFSAYRGSLFGWLWLIAAPLGLLVFYSASIASIPSLAALTDKGSSRLVYPLFIFCGLIYFQMFSELLIRAPHILLVHLEFLKKVIFPIEVLAWVALARCLVASLVLMVILIVFAVAVQGPPTPAIVLLPIIFGSFCLTMLGVVWVLSVLGAVLRDLSYFIASIVPGLLFATPLFYSMSDVGDGLRPWLYLNPLTFYIEATREIVIGGGFPRWPDLLGGIVLGIVVFQLGHSFFAAIRNWVVDAL